MGDKGRKERGSKVNRPSRKESLEGKGGDAVRKGTQDTRAALWSPGEVRGCGRLERNPHPWIPTVC